MLSALALSGFIIALVGTIWILVAAFQTSVLWGLGVLFIQFPVELIWVALHFRRGWLPFLMKIAGIFIFLGAILAEQP